MNEGFNRRDFLKNILGGAAAAAAVEMIPSKAVSEVFDLGDGQKLYIRDQDVDEFTQIMKSISEINERQEEAKKRGDVEVQKKIIKEIEPLLERGREIMQRSREELIEKRNR